ncbi:MAG: hypothetical protein LBI56_03345 [Puniceicoccales bacterium]|jgi:hypothetical protein|nr:hypothetical protein [Puniceicoccales bacterium]
MFDFGDARAQAKMSGAYVNTGRAASPGQLKFLDNGYAIDTIMAARSSIGIDTPEDLERAKLHLKNEKSRAAIG